ncbi:MAG: CHASE2 domain-containing protein [Acidobacteriia bacterium]|nr:CHASE2 domain-containing protein [Terriglobia bacterium]
MQQLNSSCHDLLFRIRGPAVSVTVPGIAIIAIDDQTASRYGPLPLNRITLARGLDALSSLPPRVLVVDLLLSESTSADQDSALASSLSRFPSLVLGAALENEPTVQANWILPLPAFRASARLGHVHAQPDPDGVARSVLLAKAGRKLRLWALAFEAARLSLQSEKPLESRDSLQLGPARIPASDVEDRLMLVNYAGPEATFPRYSFSSLIEGLVPPERLRNKIVLIGVTAQGSGDRLFTPFSEGQGMSGVEIHANILRTILDQSFLVPIGVTVQCAGYALLVAVCLIAVRYLSGIRLILSLAVVALSIPFFSLLAFGKGNLWPVASLLAVFSMTAASAVAMEYAGVSLALRRAEDRRKDYARRVQSIAHEIKTPLTAIQGSSEMISEACVSEGKRIEVAGLIHKESKRLSTIIQTFLDVERMAAGGLEIQKRSVPLAPLCEEVVERASLLAVRKRIVLHTHIPPLTVAADADLLSFALYNLLTNAIKYSPKGTAIQVTATSAKAAVSISVADQGYGIAPEERTRIFQKFYRLKRDRESQEPGSGIGLALVREIVDQHGGRIVVENQPGGGSRFTMVLPQ